MEDYFESLLYLAAGIVYLVLKNLNSRNVGKQPMTGKHAEPPTASTNQLSTRKGETQEVPVVKKPLLQNKMQEVPLYPRQTLLNKAITQQPTDKRADRLLRRYCGWKKVIVMGELIRPYC